MSPSWRYGCGAILVALFAQWIVLLVLGIGSGHAWLVALAVIGLIFFWAPAVAVYVLLNRSG